MNCQAIADRGEEARRQHAAGNREIVVAEESPQIGARMRLASRSVRLIHVKTPVSSIALIAS
jgi:hypothetical protein